MSCIESTQRILRGLRIIVLFQPKSGKIFNPVTTIVCQNKPFSATKIEITAIGVVIDEIHKFIEPFVCLLSNSLTIFKSNKL